MKRPNVHAEAERLEHDEILNEETQWVFNHGTIGHEL